MQIGIGASAIKLDHLSQQQEQLIQLLYRGVADAAFEQVAQEVGASKRETAELVARIAPALIQTDSNLKPLEQSDSQREFIDQAFAEIIRASFSTNRDGNLVLANRATKTVYLSELNRVGLVLLQGLASAGVGEICTEDQTPVSRQDLGQLGFKERDLQRTRFEAAKALVSETSQPARITFGKAADISVYLANHLSHTPNSAGERMTRAVSLHIELGIDESRVSPILIRGVTACTACRVSQEQRRDPDWAAVVTQLKFRSERLDDAQTALLTAGFALERILRWLDSGTTSDNEMTAIDYASAMVRSEAWSIDPKCPCQVLS